jgi:ABC-type glycerol-3-phosphate transport system substrate-binding protein
MQQKRVSRRDFLRQASVGGVGILLTACGTAPAAPSASTDQAAAPTEMATDAPPEPTVAQVASTGDKARVTLWGWWEERMAFFQMAGDDFARDNPDVEVKVETLGDDLWPKLFAAIEAGTGPTLCKMQTTNYFRLRDQDTLLELPPESFGDLSADYPTHAWDSYGRYCMPEGIQTAIFAYNKTMFTEAGLDPEQPPRTWVDFFTAAKQLTKRDANGTITQEGYAPDSWLPLLNPLYQVGGTPTVREGDGIRANFETPEMARALQFFVDAAQVHQVWDPDFPYFTDAIGNRQAAMMIGEAWSHGVFKNDFPETYEELGFGAPPTPTGEADPYYGRQNMVLGLAMMKGRSENETNAGRRYMEYLYNERQDTLFELANISGLVPAHVEIMNSDRVKNDPFLSLGAELAPKEYDAVEVSSDLDKVLTDTFAKIRLEGLSIADAQTYAQTEVQKLIDEEKLKYLR